MQRFGFENDTIKIFKSLYLTPTARIKINGDISEHITLERGCRQGCPLSPTLFALFIEPLAQLLRDDSEIRGVVVKDIEHKICLYADDVLLFLTDPESSLPKVMYSLKKFGLYSGYKLNIHKTQTLVCNYNPSNKIRNEYTFKWNTSSIKYLGVQIPADLSTIYKINYCPITEIIKMDLNRWILLPLDLHNRIEIIKMNILPRLLFLFQALPIEIPKRQFDEWKKLISRFIWKSGRLRVRFNTLQLPKDQGGRGLPSLDDYYKAAQLRHLVCWCNDEYSAKLKDFEQSQLELPLQVLLGDINFQKTQLNKLNFLTKIPLDIWYKELRNSKIERQGRILRWVEHDLQFKPAGLDLRFKQWSLQGITSFCLISTENELESFQQLSHKYNLEKQDFFRYLQVRHYFNKNIRDPEDAGSSIVQIFVDTYKKC